MTSSPRRSRGAGSWYTSESEMPSSRTSSSRTLGLRSSATSSRTAGPKRRRKQLALHRLQQVLGVVLFDLDVLVARDPERVVVHHLHAGEQVVQVRADDLLERHKAARLVGQGRGVGDLGGLALGVDAQEPGQRLGHLDAGKVLLAGVGIHDLDGEVERQPGDVRERVCGVHGERRQDREDVGAEELAQAAAARAPRGRRAAPG